MMIKQRLRSTYHRAFRKAREAGFFPTQRFILMCHQRSGSNMMTSILNQHPKIIMRGQLFKDDPEYQKDIQRLGTVPFTGHFFDDEIESREQFDRLQALPDQREPRNAKAVVDSFYHGQSMATRSTRVGIKFHGGTLYDDEIDSIFFGDQPYHVMVLHRDNLLAAGISWYQARELNQWVSRSADKVKKPAITVDIDVLTDFVYRTRDDVAQWKEMLAKHGKDYLELTYEQITGEDFSYDLVWNHLGVNSIPTPAPNTVKLIKNYDHLLNLDEIRAAFAGKGVGMI